MFAESRRLRLAGLMGALDTLSTPVLPHSEYSVVLAQLNWAAPIKIDLGNGWIECDKFGSIHDELGMVSYRARNHRADCNALLGGVKLASIKGAKLI